MSQTTPAVVLTDHETDPAQTAGTLSIVATGAGKADGLAVCKDSQEVLLLCKWRDPRPARIADPGKGVTARPGRDGAWVRTSRVSDIARAVAGALIG